MCTVCGSRGDRPPHPVCSTSEMRHVHIKDRTLKQNKKDSNTSAPCAVVTVIRGSTQHGRTKVNTSCPIRPWLHEVLLNERGHFLRFPCMKESSGIPLRDGRTWSLSLGVLVHGRRPQESLRIQLRSRCGHRKRKNTVGEEVPFNAIHVLLHDVVLT